MSRYRKKPVVIDAWQFDAPMFQKQPAWFGHAMMAGKMFYQGGEHPYYTIKTLEGEMRANPGDWIVRGIKGELYPCKPDIFAATYEAADD